MHVSASSADTIGNVPGLHSPPEVVCVEVPRKLRIDVDNMYIALCRIAYDSLVVFAGSGVSFDIDAESAVELKLQSVV